MTDNLESELKFINYTVNDLVYKINYNFDEQDVEVDFSIKRKIDFLDDEKNKMLVHLTVSVFEDAEENNYPFSLTIDITGVFELKNVDDEVERKKYAEVNAVAILFPYIRSLISTITANVNIPPLILPPINIVKLIENEEE
ncbi:MAG TPA: protein-export chaperone SecB [Bacillota bacterium]|nr:protein-export chaperone SecB [Bacillota bacterium]